MSNALPNVTLPASASASVHHHVPVPRREPLPLSREEWDFLLEERLAIMHESGLTLARAQALALADTRISHGPRGDA